MFSVRLFISTNNRPLIGISLDEGTIQRLRDGEPLVRNGNAYGRIDGEVDIVIVAAANMSDMLGQLVRDGIVRPMKSPFDGGRS